MKKRTAFIGAILSLIPLGQPLLFKTGVVLSTTGLILTVPEKAQAESASNYYQLGRNDFEKGNFFEAISNFNKALKIKPDFAQVYISSCGAKINIGMYADALKDCDKALSISKSSKSVYIDKATLFANRCGAKLHVGDLYEAIFDCNKALEVDPRKSLAFYNRSVSKEKIGDIKGACFDAKKAVEFGFEDENNKIWIKAKC